MSKIMVVDDGELEAGYVKLMLVQSGVDESDVWIYNSFKASQEAFRKSVGSWSGAVLDVLLITGKDGITLGKYMREKSPDMPILFFTGYDLDATVGMRAELESIGSVLQKGSAAEDVVDKMRDLFN